MLVLALRTPSGECVEVVIGFGGGKNRAEARNTTGGTPADWLTSLSTKVMTSCSFTAIRIIILQTQLA